MTLYWLYQYANIWFALLILIGLWDLAWKGLALWRAAKRREGWWFFALLILNTVGIFPMLYLIFTSDPDKKTGIVTIQRPNGQENNVKAQKAEPVAVDSSEEITSDDLLSSTQESVSKARSAVKKASKKAKEARKKKGKK